MTAVASPAGVHISVVLCGFLKREFKRRPFLRTARHPVLDPDLSAVALHEDLHMVQPEPFADAPLFPLIHKKPDKM
jgi:hypothetical protein